MSTGVGCIVLGDSLAALLCIRTPNTGQLNPLFNTFLELRPVVNSVVARQSTNWLATNAQFSPNAENNIRKLVSSPVDFKKQTS